MKKLLTIVLSGLLLLSLTACSGSRPTGDWDWQAEPKAESTGVTINVCNWGDYIDESVLRVNDAFTHMTGIEVNYSFFDTNESLYTMLAAGTIDYDVVVPSDYMVGKLVEENLLAELNFDNIPNYQYIDESLRDAVYDPNNKYSVPYLWGLVGIFYNSKYVDQADLAQGWDILWNEKYAGKIFMFGNPRDAFGVAQFKLGYSVNSTNTDEWRAAYDELVKQKPLVQQYLMDQVYEKMISEEGWLAPYYAGDGMIMMDEEEGNPDIQYFVPGQGTNLFVDALCIPKTSKHQAEAEVYINFLCRTEVAKANAEFVGYSTPHTEARKQLDPAVGENPNYYPSADVLAKTEMFMTLPTDINVLLDELFNQLLM